MIEACCRHLPKVRVLAFEGLLVSFVRQQGARVILMGLRAVSDFDYEFQLAAMNRQLAPDSETLFLMTSLPFAYLSASIGKEIALLNGDSATGVTTMFMDAGMDTGDIILQRVVPIETPQGV